MDFRYKEWGGCLSWDSSFFLKMLESFKKTITYSLYFWEGKWYDKCTIEKEAGGKKHASGKGTESIKQKEN